MPTYMKAYRLAEVQRYPRFGEANVASASLASDAIVYLREDLAVVSGCFGSDVVVFQTAAPEWQSFCRAELGFEVPDWEAESLRMREPRGVALP